MQAWEPIVRGFTVTKSVTGFRLARVQPFPYNPVDFCVFARLFHGSCNPALTNHPEPVQEAEK